MIDDRSSQLEELAKRIGEVGSYLHIDAKREKLAELEEQVAAPGFWDDASHAQQVTKAASDLRDDIATFDRARSDIEEATVANELAIAEDDEALAAEADSLIEALKKAIDTLELSSWFDGEFDHGDAVVSINPGAGGIEAQDWTAMLFRMLTRYAEEKGWKVSVNDAPAGEEIGLDHATFTVSGKDAYGMLRSEDGVHRLVRISPTDEKKRRHTTFAAVQVLPVLPDEIEIEINPNDLRIDVYRSSGPGGQSVNTTDSAVRITHIPSGLVVTCQNEKSQIQNRESAMRILRARLYEIEERKRQQELDELRGDKRHIEFGSQIRNYVLYPYQLVKDVRTGVESGNVEAVLDGDLDRFVIEFHRWRVSNRDA